MRNETAVWRLKRTPQRGINTASIRRRLAHYGTVTSRTLPATRLEFSDTFDERLRRRGLVLAGEGASVSLRDAHDGQVILTSPSRARTAPRAAGELPAGELRDRVADVAQARALLAPFSAVIRETEFRLGKPGEKVTARVLWQRVSVRRGSRPANVELLVVTGLRPRRLRELSREIPGVVRSPAQRGWYDTLRHTAGVRAPYPPRPALAPLHDASLRVAAAGIFRHFLRVMEQNEAGLCDDLDAEFLHDFRVALRRTRTGLTQMEGLFPAVTRRDFRARFADLARECGPLRDLDVQLGWRSDYETMVPKEVRSGLASVFLRVERDREREHARFVQVLQGTTYRRLKQDWRGMLRQLETDTPLGIDADDSAVRVLSKVVKRRHENLRARLLASEEVDDAALHGVRVAGKKLRYAIEFLEPWIPEEAGQLTKRMERVQSVLGEYNDVRVQIRYLNAALHDPEGPTASAPMRAAAIGAVLAMLERRRAKLRIRAEERLEEIADRAWERALLRATAAAGQ